MGSIISLILIGALYSIVYVVKNLRTNPGKQGGAFSESFPTIEILEPEQADVPVAPRAEKREHSSAMPKQHKSRVEYSRQAAVPSTDEKRDIEAKTQERLVKLNNKSDAKRAFLYSEIFNRKY